MKVLGKKAKWSLSYYSHLFLCAFQVRPLLTYTKSVWIRLLQYNLLTTFNIFTKSYFCIKLTVLVPKIYRFREIIAYIKTSLYRDVNYWQIRLFLPCVILFNFRPYQATIKRSFLPLWRPWIRPKSHCSRELRSQYS